MKTKSPLILVLAIFSLWQTNTYAQCDVNNNFYQATKTNHYRADNTTSTIPFTSVGQTFIATCSGPVEGVTLFTDHVETNNGDASVRAEIWQNPSSTNRVRIGSQTRNIPPAPFNNPADYYFAFGSQPELISGTEYAVIFVLNNTEDVIAFDINVNNIYGEGHFIRDFISSDWNENWDLKIRIHYEDSVKPIVNCRNITRALGANNTVSINANDINNGSTDADSGIATRVLSKYTFDCNDVGYNTVRLFVTDQNGNTGVCEADVWIEDGNDPVLTCPGDMTVYADPETGTAIVNFADATYDDCTVEWIDDFDFLGTHDGKSYFVSQIPLVPSEAFTNAEALGGYLATIIDAEQNEMLTGALAYKGVTESVIIGFNDLDEEDTYVWHNPNATSNYDNWHTGEPNNSGNEDYTILTPSGTWNDIRNSTAYNYILEKSEPTIRFAGTPSGSEFPVGTTINTFSATDAFGNQGFCYSIIEVLPPPIETTVVLDNGELIITDVLLESSDQITFSSDGTTLTISDLIRPSVSGGPTLVDLTTVTVPLASITNGIVFNAGNGSNTGFNIISFANDLTLTGVDNDITLNGLRGYVQTGSINIEGDLTINGVGFGLTLFGFDLTLGEITANNLTIDGVDRILDQELALNISGVTQMQAGDGINIENGQGRHSFVGEVHLTSNELIFSAGANTTFGDITATDVGIGIAHTLTVAPGDITFIGIVNISESDSSLHVYGSSNIAQTTTAGYLDVPFLNLIGDGTTIVTLDNNNTIQALATDNPFDANAVDLASLSFTNTSNMFLEIIDVNEFNLTASELDIEPGFTKITKRGSGVSNFNADIDVNSGTGTAIFNHIAGTINFNGGTNDFLSQMTYIGQPGTITNINSVTTSFPFAGTNRFFIFGTLNATGAIDAGDIDINLSDGANFSLNTTSLTGVPYVQGALTNISGGAKITPGGGTTGLEYSFDDLIMDSGATFAPLIEGTGVSEFDKLLVNGTVTLNDANLEPIGGFAIASGDELIIVDNQGPDAVVGTFNNLAEGSDVVFGDFTGIISYKGGDGNDIVLFNPETKVELTDAGSLNITDINGGVSNDAIVLSNDGTTLTISNLTAPVYVNDGVTIVSETSVSVPIDTITNGFQFSSEEGSDSITINEALTLSGTTNYFEALNIDNYAQNGPLTIGGDLTIEGNGTNDITLSKQITAGSLSISGFMDINETDSPAQINISGTTTIDVSDNISITRGITDNHIFGGEVSLKAAKITFSAWSDTTFGAITTTSTAVNFNVIDLRGDIIFNGDVNISDANSHLTIGSIGSIHQTGGVITAKTLTINGNGIGTVTLDQANEVETLLVKHRVFDTFIACNSLSFTNSINLHISGINVDEFTLTAPKIELKPGTFISKQGTGVSNFNADIEVNDDGTGTAYIFHDAGTINFNGAINDFNGAFDYIGATGTITNFNGVTSFDTQGISLSFGFLNVSEAFTLKTFITTSNEARFNGANALLRGLGTLSGGPVIIENNGAITPGMLGAVSNIDLSDLLISSATYAPVIESDDDYDILEVVGTITLTDAEFAPIGGFTAQPDTIEMILIDNDGTDPVVGTFNNLPEGSEVVFGDFTGIISYKGGDGNDIVLSIAETEVDFTAGTLTINDINGAVSNDDITLFNDGTTLIISNLIAPIKIVGAVTSVSETSVSVPLASITNGFQFLSEGGVDSITINDALTLSGSDNYFVADNIDNYTQNAALTVGGTIWLSGTDTSNILFGEITASNLNLIEFNNVDDSDGKRLNISDDVAMRVNGIVNIDNGSGNESDHFFGGLVDIEAALVSNFTTGSDLSISIRTTATDGVNNITASPGDITLSGTTTTAGDSDINVSATTSITQLADATITTDELIITSNANTTVSLLSATNDINLLTAETLVQNLSITDVDDIELGTITVNEFTITAPSINMTSETAFTKTGSGEGSFVGFSYSNSGTGIITHEDGTIIFNGDSVLFGGITYNGGLDTTTKFTGGQTFIGNNFTFGTLLAEDRFVIESGVVTVLDQTIVGNDVGPDNLKVLGGYGTFTGGSSTTISTNGEILPFTFGSLTFENNLRIENGGKFNALLFGTELDDYSRINVTGTVELDNAELDAAFSNLSSEVGPGFELVIIDNDGVDPIVGTFNGYPEGSMLEASVGGTIKTGTLSYTLGDGNDFGWKYDDEAPTAACQDITLNIDLGGTTVTGDQLDGGATDDTEITEILIDGQASIDFTYDDDGDHQVTVTFADTNGNTAECMATITINSNATLPILISEYQPVTSGGPIQEIEIKGKPGESFSGTFVVLEGISSNNIGLVRSADNFSGTFDANGLLTAIIPDLQDPSHTSVLTSSFTGTVGVTDVDTDDDGTVDDITNFGLILDAVGITNGAVCCPIDVIYGEEFGGADLAYIGGQAAAIFREASVGDFYQIALSNGDIYDNTATIVDASIFNTTPTVAGTFGQINPALAPTIYTYNNDWSPMDPSGISTSTSIIEVVSGDASISTNTIADNIVVRAGAGLTVNSGVTLETISGIRLESTSIAYSSLISDGTIIGTVDYLRHVNQGASSGGNDLITPPVSGQSFTDFLLANSNIVSNGDNSLYLFGPFDKTTGSYVTYSNVESVTLNSGVGFRAATIDNGTLHFQGTVNQDVVNQNVFNSGPAFSQWNLIGNPYSSYLNIQDFLTNTTNASVLDETNVGIYGYDGDASDGWVIYNLNTIDANTSITPGQGFFVAIDSDASIEFTPSMRRHGSTDDFIIGRNPSINYHLSLQMSSSQNNSYHTDFYFNTNSTNGLDPGYDAAVFGSTAGSFAIYSHLIEDNTGIDMAIQSLSLEFINDGIIPLGVNADDTEQLTIGIETSNLPQDIEVYLEDRDLNVFTLLNTSDYVFTPTTELNGTGRFYFHFSNMALSNLEAEENALNIYTLKEQKEIVIRGQLLEASNAELFDLNGRKVLDAILNTQSDYNTVDVAPLQSGVYILQISSNSYTQTQKVVIH
ncbi:hypothetical protein FBALC1_04657 [Flavobacteriales bacterium ALC-1]|nr:hypothetical protein FBALC1_04657 [Flavobacteriales bacterium ALC-1]